MFGAAGWVWAGADQKLGKMLWAFPSGRHKSPTGLQCTAVQEGDEPRGRQGSTLAHVPLKAVPPNMG